MGKEDGAIALTVILILAAAIAISKTLFPYFVIGAFLSFILLILSVVFKFDAAEVLLWPLGICLVGAIFTYAIGFGFGDSSIGKATTTVADAFNLISDTEKNATLTVIDTSQQATNEIYRSSNSTTSQNIEKTANTSYDILRTVVKIS